MCTQFDGVPRHCRVYRTIGHEIMGQFGKRKSSDGRVVEGWGSGQDPFAMTIVAVIRDTRGFGRYNMSRADGGHFTL